MRAIQSLAIAVAAILLLSKSCPVAGAPGATVSPPPIWYSEREWTLTLSGTYALTASEYPTLQNFGTQNHDTYLQTDHAWGIGIDAKYFFTRCFGVGLSASRLSVRQSFPDVSIDYFDFGPGSQNLARTSHEGRAVGSITATVTVRYPIRNSRFSPYVFGAGGGISGGGQRIMLVGSLGDDFRTSRTEDTTEWITQVGGGLEVRLTRHIGLINDFTWSFINGTNNDFGMARTGVNFAF